MKVDDDVAGDYDLHLDVEMTGVWAQGVNPDHEDVLPAHEIEGNVPIGLREEFGFDADSDMEISVTAEYVNGKSRRVSQGGDDNA